MLYNDSFPVGQETVIENGKKYIPFYVLNVPHVECISSINFSLFSQSDQKQKKSAVLFVYFFFQLLKTSFN